MHNYSRWSWGRRHCAQALATALAGLLLAACAASEERPSNPQAQPLTQTAADAPAEGPQFQALPQLPLERPRPVPLAGQSPLTPGAVAPVSPPPPGVAPPASTRPAPVYVPPTPAYVPPYVPPAATPYTPPAASYSPPSPRYEPPASTASARSVPVSSEISVQDEAPLIYVVKPGDTLWGIAKRFLKDAYQWPEVWYVNDEKVTNPHLIYPGDVLKLVYKNRRPTIVREEPALPPEPINVARLSPQLRIRELPAAIPTIPLEAIRDFLRGPRLVTSDQLAASPYLLAFSEEHLVGAAGNGVYVQNLRNRGPQVYYDVVRKGEVYRDPDNNDIIGYEAMPIAEAQVTQFGEPTSAVLSRSFREALLGDHLLPAEADAFRANFYPRPPQRAIGGRIISVYDGVSEIGQYQIVAMNRGTAHGLEPGHVLDILQAGTLAPDPYSKRRIRLPDEYAGQLLVFKVTPRVSFGLVMEVTRPVHRLDKVEKPVPGRR